MIASTAFCVTSTIAGSAVEVAGEPPEVGFSAGHRRLGGWPILQAIRRQLDALGKQVEAACILPVPGMAQST
jgi:hypothetical protein